MEAVKLDNFLKVDKGIPVPLYYQIKQGILQAIQEGALKVEDMIPTEAELCEICGISRPTIRQALGELVSEGYLYRLKGKGTLKQQNRYFILSESDMQMMNRWYMWKPIFHIGNSRC